MWNFSKRVVGAWSRHSLAMNVFLLKASKTLQVFFSVYFSLIVRNVRPNSCNLNLYEDGGMTVGLALSVRWFECQGKPCVHAIHTAYSCTVAVCRYAKARIFIQCFQYSTLFARIFADVFVWHYCLHSAFLKAAKSWPDYPNVEVVNVFTSWSSSFISCNRNAVQVGTLMMKDCSRANFEIAGL